MSDPSAVLDRLDAAEDAFSHAAGRPAFEPNVNAAPDADAGEVALQKACRLLTVAHDLEQVGDYYGAMLESSFIAIEHTLQSYLLTLTGVAEHDLRDHDRPYELAKGRVPLTADTIDRLETLYDARRTDHYYGTTVTTRKQATAMRDLGSSVHDHIVGFDQTLGTFCNCLDNR
ncbi:DNA-binding protein [Halovenus salina]|uniref:DNA-binding protein n=1 Tax=Halovenus salina TaxID=1510225 RepID=A0ABD5VX73_9EURY|nr:DNA-binding protein [Halovenus salina]